MATITYHTDKKEFIITFSNGFYWRIDKNDVGGFVEGTDFMELLLLVNPDIIKYHFQLESELVDVKYFFRKYASGKGRFDE